MTRTVHLLIKLCLPLVSSAVLLFTGPTVMAQEPLNASIDTYIEAGQAMYLSARYSDAEMLFRQAVGVDGDSAIARYWLGMSLYKQSLDDPALKEFQRATRIKSDWAQGYLGVGLVYLRKPNRKMDAREMLRSAAKRAPDDGQIQYYLGMTFVSANVQGRIIGADMDGQAYFQKAIALNPQHPDAYYQLGLSSEYPLREYDRALFFYFKQLTVASAHDEALKRLGEVTYILERHREGLEMIDQLIALQGSDADDRFHTVRAQMAASHLHSQQDYAGASIQYRNYIDALGEAERAHYADIQFASPPEVHEKILGAQSEERDMLIRNYWASRDPNPATVVNERLVEHYRRVMFSRIHFSAGKAPWDRRGEMYIRYGDADDRQRFLGGSNETDAFMSGGGTNRSSVRELGAGPNVPVAEHDFIMPTGRADVDAVRELNREFRYRLRARGAHATESWVYVRHGLEFFFVDQRGNGEFDYPDIMMDPTALVSLTGGAHQERFHPETVAKLLIAKTPEDYRHDFGGDLLQFVFDTVTFRGVGGKTEVELTYSIPSWQFGSVQDGMGLRTWLQNNVTLRDDDLNPVIAHAERFGPIERPTKPQVRRNNDVALHSIAVSFEAPPGTFETGVELQDEATRLVGVFRKDTKVSDYSGDSLLVSDLKLSTFIEKDDGAGQFVRGGFQIAPNPGHLFQRNQPVYVYYEIYNLTVDEVGDTRFETIYEIAPQGFIMRDREQPSESEDDPILLMFEDGGSTPVEKRFAALDTSDLAEGEYAMTMTMRDLATGKTVSKTTSFVIVGNKW